MVYPSNRLNVIRLVQGQTKVVTAIIKAGDGRIASLSGASLYMSVRKTAGSPVLISKETGDGIEATDPSKGEITITLSTSDTDLLEAGSYRYDLWIVYPGCGSAPDTRYPVVQYAEIHVEDSVTDFAE